MHYRFAAVDLFSFRSVAGFVVAVCSVAADVAADCLHLALVVAVHPGAAVAADGFVVAVRLVVGLDLDFRRGVVVVVSAVVLFLYLFFFCCYAPAYAN